MLFPVVTERLARVARHPAIEEALEALRRGSTAETIAGLTDPCKALVVALAAIELRRPVLWLVDTERRAEEMLEAARFFIRTLGGSSASRFLAAGARRIAGPRRGAASGTSGNARRGVVALCDRAGVGDRFPRRRPAC